jgi:UDP-2,3-diacylglucosamine hydrolase
VQASDRTGRGSGRALSTAILAGSGKLPEYLAEGLFRKGDAPLCVSIDGQADRWIGRFDHLSIKSVQVGVLVRALKARQVKQVVLAGGLRARPSLWSLRPDWVSLTNFLRFYKALGMGDDALLRCVIALLEEQGFEVIGAHEILPELTAPKGVLTKRQPTDSDKRDRDMALAAALAAGRDDLGQAAVAIAGKIAGIEDAKGTDAMLLRVEKLYTGERIAACGVLAKAVKPQQERRADLPSIGPETVDNAVRAGLAGIAVSAGSSLILDRDEVVKRANAAGIFVEGCAMGRRDE